MIHLIGHLLCCMIKVTTREALRREDHSTEQNRAEQYRIEQNGTEQEEHSNWPPLEREVRDEMIQQHALSTCQGRACAKCCNQECQGRFWNCLCITTYYSVATIVIVVSLGALIVLGILYVLPYFTYKVTQCDVVSVDDHHVFSCHCVKISVKYTREDGDMLQALLDVDGDQDECSNKRCGSPYIAQKMMQDYKPPHSFKCLYDASLKLPHVRIYGFLPKTAEVVNMLVWPIMMSILAIAVIVFIWRTCGCKCEYHPPKNIRTIADNLRLHGIHTLKSLPAEEKRRLVRECSPDPEVDFQTQQMQRV